MNNNRQEMIVEQIKLALELVGIKKYEYCAENHTYTYVVGSQEIEMYCRIWVYPDGYQIETKNVKQLGEKYADEICKFVVIINRIKKYGNYTYDFTASNAVGYAISNRCSDIIPSEKSIAENIGISAAQISNEAKFFEMVSTGELTAEEAFSKIIMQ